MVAALIATNVFAQSPDLLSYQAVIRDASNNLVKNIEIGLQISILQTSESGTAVYVETHSPTTNNNGLATVEIGDGSVVSGTFASIDWSAGPYFIKTEIDPDGGTTYTVENTTQILSVPYALYSEKAATATSLVNPPFSYFSGSGTSGIIYRAGDVALGAYSDPDDNGLYVQNYTSGKAAVLGADRNSSNGNTYAEGMLGVLNGSNIMGLPVDVVNAGVYGIKPALGNNGAAVYGWNNDENLVNYGGVFVADGAGTTNYGIYTTASNGTNNYAGYFSGRIGINQLDPVSDIHLYQTDGLLDGTGGMSFQRSTIWKIMHTGTHFSFVLDNVRMAYVEGGTGDYVVESDASLKTDIEEMGPVLDKVLQLKPVKYRFIRQDESANKTIGFLAQDVEKLFPGLSHQAEDGTLGLSYTDFGILSIQAIQEQQSQIEALKAENALLRAEVEAIKAMLE